MQSDLLGAPAAAIPVEPAGSSMLHLGEADALYICVCTNIFAEARTLLKYFYWYNGLLERVDTSLNIPLPAEVPPPPEPLEDGSSLGTVIVGAGPAGLLTACLLAKVCHRVSKIELHVRNFVLFLFLRFIYFFVFWGRHRLITQ